MCTPQLIKLGKTAAWTWEDPMVSMDTVAMSTYYGVQANREGFWQPDTGISKVRVTCPHMLALPPDCAVLCAKERHPPAELFAYISQVLESVDIYPVHFTRVLDWCCVPSQPGIGMNTTSSLLSFAMPAVIGPMEHLQEWAHNRLRLTIESMDPPESDKRTTLPQAHLQPMTREAIDVTMLANMTAVKVAALQAQDTPEGGYWETQPG